MDDRVAALPEAARYLLLRERPARAGLMKSPTYAFGTFLWYLHHKLSGIKVDDEKGQYWHHLGRALEEVGLDVSPETRDLVHFAYALVAD